MKYRIAIVLFSLALLQSCAGTTHTYKSLINKEITDPAIYMSVNETKQVLAISDGFPGWWGFYPTILSYSPEIASVSCTQERGWIPFRDPGVIFGGTVCYLTSHKIGETWISFGNKYGGNDLDNPDSHNDAIKVVVTSSSSL